LQPKFAGLGIYIIYLQVNPANTIYATHNKIYLVVNAEAAGLALAATILNKLNLCEIAYFSDCSNLVDYINSEDPSDPPDWHVLPCIQDFNLAMRLSRYTVSKISHHDNSIADSLAKLAFNSPHIQSKEYVPGCSYETHFTQCPLLGVLPRLNFTLHMVLAATCC
jgi:hypothetical protein